MSLNYDQEESMDNSDSDVRFDPVPERAGRPRAKTNSAVPTYTLPTSSQNALFHQGGQFTRQRSLSTNVPTINIISCVDPSLDASQSVNPVDTHELPGDIDELADPLGFSRLPEARLEVGLGLYKPFVMQQNNDPLPPMLSEMQPHDRINNWNLQNYSDQSITAYSSFLDGHGGPSPGSSPVPSPSFSPTFNTAFGCDGLLPLPYGFPIPAVSDPDSIPMSACSTMDYLNSPDIESMPQRPLLSFYTQRPAPSASTSVSDVLSGSTAEEDGELATNRSTLTCASSSGPTSPFLTSSSPPLSPYPSSEAFFDDGQFVGIGSQHQQLPELASGEGSTSNLFPQVSSTSSLQVPSHSGRNLHTLRRDSDPSSWPCGPRHVGIIRSTSTRGSNRRGRSPRPERTIQGEADLQEVLDSSIASPVSTRRSRSETPGQSPRGRRQRPMTDEGKADASDRRNYKDICIGCKSSKIKCEPCPEQWEACTKCSSALTKGTGAWLCGKYYFSQRVSTHTLDYTAESWITPIRPNWPTPSRLLIPMPDFLNVPHLHENFRSLIRSSYKAIRVSSNTTTLYDIDLQGAIRYLSRECSVSLASSRTWRIFITNLAESPEDGWLECLTSRYRPDSKEQILSLLPTWTVQQGCFTYSLVPASGQSIQPLDPENLEEKAFIISAAQVSRIIGRKVERIALEHLQKTLPSDKNKLLPSSPANPQHVRILGLHALALRFQYHRWNLPGHPNPVDTCSVNAREECIDALRWVCRSLYVYHCWLLRHVVPAQPGDPLMSLQINTSSYAGAGNLVKELMSKGETNTGFMEWWREGADKAREANMDPIVVEKDVPNPDALMKITGYQF